MTAAEQLAEIAAKANALRDCNVRQVAGGFIINANTRYADKDSGGVLASISHETVAADADAAVAKVAHYLANGNFG
jgi:hypothetical protein